MSILLGPIITEKTSVMKEQGKMYFKVRNDANKVQIKQEIERIFGVKVQSVNTMNVQGKEKRFGKHSGKMSDWKKAVVVLKQGEKLQEYEDLF
jgi:large subunit ribosomal protein L23